jgi:anaerobic magnesium-protoporphyrin IX monomethyl ester cyclase
MNFKGTPVKVVACGAPDDLQVSESDLPVKTTAAQPKMTAVQSE